MEVHSYLTTKPGKRLGDIGRGMDEPTGDEGTLSWSEPGAQPSESTSFGVGVYSEAGSKDNGDPG